MTQITVPSSVPADIIGLVANAVELAEATNITCEVTASIAGEDLRTLAGMKKSLEESRFSITRPMDAAKKAVMELFAPQAEKIDAADKILRGKLNAYLLEQRAIQAKAEAEARAKAAAEKAEADRKIAEAKAAAEAAAKAGDDAAAEAARNAVRDAQDDALLAELSAPVVQATPKMAGVSTAKIWKVTDIDLSELVKAAAEDPELLEYLIPNTAEINKVVKALGARHKIPGVTAAQTESLRVRS